MSSDKADWKKVKQVQVALFQTQQNTSKYSEECVQE